VQLNANISHRNYENFLDGTDKLLETENFQQLTLLNGLQRNIYITANFGTLGVK